MAMGLPFDDSLFLAGSAQSEIRPPGCCSSKNTSGHSTVVGRLRDPGFHRSLSFFRQIFMEPQCVGGSAHYGNNLQSKRDFAVTQKTEQNVVQVHRDETDKEQRQ